jgi:hypothetical protein
MCKNVKSAIFDENGKKAALMQFWSCAWNFACKPEKLNLAKFELRVILL